MLRTGSTPAVAVLLGPHQRCGSARPGINGGGPQGSRPRIAKNVTERGPKGQGKALAWRPPHGLPWGPALRSVSPQRPWSGWPASRGGKGWPPEKLSQVPPSPQRTKPTWLGCPVLLASGPFHTLFPLHLPSSCSLMGGHLLRICLLGGCPHFPHPCNPPVWLQSPPPLTYKFMRGPLAIPLL